MGRVRTCRKFVKRGVLAGLLIFAGAVLSVGVAWGIVIWHELAKTEPNRAKRFAVPLRGSESEMMFIANIEWFRGMAVCSGLNMEPRKMPAHYDSSDPDLPSWFRAPPAQFGESRTTLAAGFPLLCMKFEWEDGWDRVPQFKGALALPMLREVPVIMVPLQPMYLGLVVNGVMYAGTLVLTVCGVRRSRRGRRVRRGRCRFCSYDLRGEFGKPCPECGNVS